MSESTEIKKDNSSATVRSELFVRGLSSDTTNDDLVTFFSDFAPVKHAIAVNDSATGGCKGFGFVSFAEKDDSKTAKEQSKGKKLKGKVLQIDYAKPRGRKGDEDGDNTKEAGDDNDSKATVEKRRPRLIIRNMPWSVRDSKALEKIFSKYGKVADAYIPRGPGGRMSGFAFVTMRKKRHAMAAIEKCKGLKIAGREVAVDFAVEKGKWQKMQEGESIADQIESDSDSEGNDEDEVDDEDDEVDDQEQESIDGDSAEEDDDEGSEAEEEEEAAPQPAKKGLKPVSNTFEVFVRNIPYDATSESLKEHFSQFGKIRYALPVMDKEKNMPKGTAFVAFVNENNRNECVQNAPAVSSSTLLVPDDADPRYVMDGRILSISKAVDKNVAEKLTTANAKQRDALLGKEQPMDKRKLFLLNEGRIASESALGQSMTKAELDIRDQSYQQRKKQITDNPSLHLSLVRLAVRNIPRSMNEKALKALGRKAVVEFAREASDGKRQPLTKEELKRSSLAKKEEPKSQKGVIRQSKVIYETKKGSGESGRSRGYGFLEFRDHKSALMGLRWLNAHKVTKEEIALGLSEEQAEKIEPDSTVRRLVVEFALEHAQVVKRRKDGQAKMAQLRIRRKEESEAQEKAEKEEQAKAAKQAEFESKKRKADPVRQIIGKKRKERRTSKKGGSK